MTRADPRTKTAKALTAKAQRFVDEYLIDRNGAAAAIRAGYSKRSAKQAAHEMLLKPEIAAAVAKAAEAQQKRTLITADQVLLDIQDIGDQALKASDYAQALRSRELLGKRYKLFTEKVEVVQTVPRAERLRQARERRQKERR